MSNCSGLNAVTIIGLAWVNDTMLRIWQHPTYRTVLGSFTKLQRVTISFVMSVRSSGRNISASIERIFMKFEYFSKICREISVVAKINLKKHEFSRQIFEKSSVIKLHENLSSGSRVVPRGQTDRTGEANSRFSQFCWVWRYQPQHAEDIACAVEVAF